MFAGGATACTETILQGVDNLFYFGGKQAEVLAGTVKGEKLEVVLKDGESSMCAIALKVIFCATIIFPLIALVIKCALRSSFDFKVVAGEPDKPEKLVPFTLEGFRKLEGVDAALLKEISPTTYLDLMEQEDSKECVKAFYVSLTINLSRLEAPEGWVDAYIEYFNSQLQEHAIKKHTEKWEADLNRRLAEVEQAEEGERQKTEQASKQVSMRPTLEEFYKKKGIDKNPKMGIGNPTCKDLELDPNESTMGKELRVEYGVNLDGSPNKDVSQPVYKSSEIKMSELVKLVVSTINDAVSKDHDGKSTGDHRLFAFEYQNPPWKIWHESGMKPDDFFADDFCMTYDEQAADEEGRWLRRVIDALAEKDYIYGFERLQRGHYLFQA